MAFLDQLEQAITETGHSISRKAKDLAEITKKKNMLHTCEEVIDRQYSEIGKAYYEAHKEEEDNPYAQQCRAVRDAQRGAEALQKQIDAIRE